jgi:hypothetical protein
LTIGNQRSRPPGPLAPPAERQRLFPTLTKTLRVFFVVRKKLPFAGYSVVKHHPGGLRPAGPPDSVARGDPSDPHSAPEERAVRRASIFPRGLPSSNSLTRSPAEPQGPFRRVCEERDVTRAQKPAKALSAGTVREG